MGEVIPMVMATTSDAKTGIKGFNAETLHIDMGKVVREFKRELRSIDVLGKTEEAVAEASDEKVEESSPLLPEQNWTNAEGQAMRAAVLEVSETEVVFLMSGGKKVTYPLANLSEESRGILQEAATR